MASLSKNTNAFENKNAFEKEVISGSEFVIIETVINLNNNE